MSRRRPSDRTETVRVAPEFAALLRRFGRMAQAGQPFKRNTAGSVAGVTTHLARYLATSPVNSPAWWVTPSPGDLLDAMPVEGAPHA